MGQNLPSHKTVVGTKGKSSVAKGVSCESWVKVIPWFSGVIFDQILLEIRNISPTQGTNTRVLI